MAMRAISPVIATVIIVSVAIAISIAVALWLTGITSGFTQTENLQISSSYAEAGNTTYYLVYIDVKNTGTTTATIDNVFINGKPASDANAVVIINVDNTNYTVSQQPPIDSGKSATIYVFLSKSVYSSGQMVNIKIHTASGRDYPTTVTLP